MALDGLIVEDHPVDALDASGHFPIGQQLQCAHAIAPDGSEQIKGFQGAGPEAGGHASADRIAVWQQALEVVRDVVAPQHFVVEVEGERQGNRTTSWRGQPGRCVFQLHVTAGGERPATYMFAVGP